MAIVAQLVTGQLAEKSAKTGCQMTAGDADYSRAAALIPTNGQPFPLISLYYRETKNIFTSWCRASSSTHYTQTEEFIRKNDILSTFGANKQSITPAHIKRYMLQQITCAKMAKCLSYKVAGEEIKIYPIISKTVNYLQSQRLGVRYEKKLTIKDVKKLISGEMTLRDFQNIKSESDKSRLAASRDYDPEEKERSVKEESESEGEAESVQEISHVTRGRGRPPKLVKRKSREVFRCRVCNSYRLRVVDYGRKDGTNILECANRKCLASIELTDKPVGTKVEAPIYSKLNHGWMMDSPWNYRWPKMSRIESNELSTNPEVPDINNDDDHEPMRFIHCPGQTALVEIM